MLSEDDFIGVWQLTRQITDRMHGLGGQFVGQTRFEKEGDRLRCLESGDLTLASGATLSADRQMFWQIMPDRIYVYYADGGLFHTFTPHGISEGTPHLCGEDHYISRYDFTAFPRWSVTWQVSGPRKDYTSVSDYHRMTA
jgi:hypothetical protein